MKICEFTQHDLEVYDHDVKPGRGIIALPTPTERAIQLLLKALKTVNRAGLDGKELSDLTLVNRYEPEKHAHDQVIEIHAKVKHRITPPTP